MRHAPPTHGASGRGLSTGAVLGAAAVGLIAGLAATVGRKAVVQGAEALAGDWFDILKAEHLMVLELFDRLEQTDETEVKKRTVLLAKIKQALDKHAAQEEMVVYPALRMQDAEGGAAKLYADHGEVKTFLYELETLAKDDAAWLSRARAFRRTLEEHIREEEETVFPAFRETLSEDEDARLTKLLHKEGFKRA